MNQAPQPRADGKYPQPQRIGEALTGVDDQRQELDRQPDEKDQQRRPPGRQLQPDPPQADNPCDGEVGPGQILPDEPEAHADCVQPRGGGTHIGDVGPAALKEEDQSGKHDQR